MLDVDEYTDLTELYNDIDNLMDNPPKTRKNGKEYKEWLKSINLRMEKYNKLCKREAFIKTWKPD